MRSFGVSGNAETDRMLAEVGRIPHRPVSDWLALNLFGFDRNMGRTELMGPDSWVEYFPELSRTTHLQPLLNED